jgi:hypothetical protein
MTSAVSGPGWRRVVMIALALVVAELAAVGLDGLAHALLAHPSWWLSVGLALGAPFALPSWAAVRCARCETPLVTATQAHRCRCAAPSCHRTAWWKPAESPEPACREHAPERR